MRLHALLRLALAAARCPLTSPHAATRRLILQKARRHTVEGAPTACGRTVSGAVSLPSRGAFHLSLAVLVRYRSQESVQAWMVVHPGSDRVSRARPYSGAASAPDPRVRLRGCNPVPPAVPCRSAPLDRCAPGAAAPGRRGPTTPAARTLPRACARRFGHGPLPLAATRGISQLISPPPGT